MKKKIKEKLDKATLHRDASRTHIGPVRPTVAFIPKKRRGQGSRRGDLTDIQGVGDENFLHVRESTGPMPTAPVLAQRDQSVPVSTGGYKPVKLGTTQHRAGEAFKYTPEVLEHANVLLKTQGAEAVATYLKEVRNGQKEQGARQMAMDNVTEAAIRAAQRTEGQQQQTSKEATTQMGPVEIALRDADRRITALDSELRTLVEERNKQVEIRDKLREAYELVTGKRAPSRKEISADLQSRPSHSTEPGQIKPRGYWEGEITEVMKAEGYRPMKKGYLQHKLSERNPDVSQGSLYQAVYGAQKKGVLVEMGDGQVAHRDFGAKEAASGD